MPAIEKITHIERVIGARIANTTADSRQADLQELLTRLKSFSQAQLDYFQTAVPEANYLHRYPIAAIISQISNDLEVIERATYQRQADTPNNFKETLALADKLAMRALKPAQSWLEPGVTPITYIHKSPMMRVIPYAPVALLGIPYTTLASAGVDVPDIGHDPAQSVWQDFMAIPHEVGHYVFAHAHIPDPANPAVKKPLVVELVERLKGYSFAKNPDVRRWLEEIFADVYGGMLGGPIMAIDFQDLQLNRSMGEFTADDAEHPIPYLRPFIYQTVLDEYFTPPYRDPVRNRWKAELGKRAYIPQIFDGDTLYPLDENRVNGELANMVKDMLQVLRGLPDLNTTPRDEVLWPVPNKVALGAPEGDIKNWLYTKYEEHIQSFKQDASGAHDAPSLSAAALTPTVWEDLRSGFRSDAERVRAAGMVFEPTLSGLTADQVAELWAGGWATEGPENNWP